MADPYPPSHAALRAFAAAGRLQSFRDAAAELRVTPSSVSQHVRAVEDWIGAPLFERGVRQVRLTERGRLLAERLQTGFDLLQTALAEARAPSGPEVLKVSALPLFTQVWLIPRLPRFEAAHPGITIEIETANRMARIAEGEADIGIRNLREPTTGLAAYKLMDLRAVPLCAPALAQELAGPADLARCTLIHVSARRDGWRDWFSAVGAGPLEGAGARVVDTVPAALEAAALGHGVMLGLDPLVWDAPQASRLVVPFATPPVSAGTYFIVHRRSDRVRAAVRLFVDWARREAASDLRRLRAASRKAAPGVAA